MTGSRWSSLVLDADDDGLSNNAHEVPPDGVVYLSFSAEVNHSVAFDTLRAANPKLRLGRVGGGSCQGLRTAP